LRAHIAVKHAHARSLDAATTALSFYPSGCQKNGGRFECYREAWYLMAPGAGLPRPGIVRRIRAIDFHRQHFAE